MARPQGTTAMARCPECELSVAVEKAACEPDEADEADDDDKAATRRRSRESPSAGALLPYWLVNVPRSQWPDECPEFLRELPAKSVRILSTPDTQFQRQDWETVKQIVSE